MFCLLLKEQNKLHFEKELCFIQDLTRGVNAAQQTHKHSQETVPALVRVTFQGVQTPACFRLISCCFDCFEIPLFPTSEFKSCILLPNPEMPRLVPPCLQFFPVKTNYPESSGLFSLTRCGDVLDYGPSELTRNHKPQCVCIRYWLVGGLVLGSHDVAQCCNSF